MLLYAVCSTEHTCDFLLLSNPFICCCTPSCRLMVLVIWPLLHSSWHRSKIFLASVSIHCRSRAGTFRYAAFLRFVCRQRRASYRCAYSPCNPCRFELDIVLNVCVPCKHIRKHIVARDKQTITIWLHKPHHRMHALFSALCTCTYNHMHMQTFYLY